MLPVILFYIFSTIAVMSAVAVVSARNPVHSVLFLILAFFNVAGLFVLLGAEFLAMLLVIVYVGAVAILFLFVVMMLNIDIKRMKESFVKYLSIGLIVATILFAELFVMLTATVGQVDISSANQPYIYNGEEITNTEVIGLILYNDYVYLFQIAGLILLVAMIGSIVLTHRKREGVRKQNINQQNARDAKTAVTLTKVETGQGVE